jgi:hypothetical protein
MHMTASTKLKRGEMIMRPIAGTSPSSQPIQ